MASENCDKCSALGKIESQGCRECMDLIGVMVVVLRTDGTVAVANTRALEILGLDDYEEIKDKNWFDVAIPDDIKTEVYGVHEALSNGSGDVGFFASYENPVVRKDGERRTIQWHNAVIRDAEGHHAYTISSGEDVTERRKLERALNQAKEDLECRVEERTEELVQERDKFKRIFSTASEGIVVLSQRGDVCEVNKAILDILQASEDVVRKMGLFGFILPEDALKFRDSVVQAVRGDVVHEVRFSIINMNGDTVPVLMSASAYPSEDEEPDKAVLLVTDISDRVAAEERMIRNETLAVAGTLAAGVAHEFNNINGIIKGNLDIILSAHELPKQVRECLVTIREMTVRSADITNNMLMFTRESKNGLGVVKLKNVVEASIRLIEHEFRSVGIRVYRGNMMPNVVVNVNGAQIAQVLMNLYINAKHAMQESPVKNLLIEMEECGEGKVAVTVADTGCGIPQEDIKCLFNPFFTTKGEHAAPGSTLSSVKGTGLGLSVAHTIMLRHGGDITVESKVGEGSLFRVILPMSKEIVEAEPEKEKAVVIGRGQRVLMLDDEAEMTKVIETLLSQFGYEVVGLTDGVRALKEHKRKPFDVAIIDLLMPNMSGVEFMSKLNHMPNVPKKIVLTGNRKDISLDGLGISKVIMKPFEVEDLIHAIQTCLSGGGAE